MQKLVELSLITTWLSLGLIDWKQHIPPSVVILRPSFLQCNISLCSLESIRPWGHCQHTTPSVPERPPTPSKAWFEFCFSFGTSYNEVRTWQGKYSTSCTVPAEMCFPLFSRQAPCFLRGKGLVCWGFKVYFFCQLTQMQPHIPEYLNQALPGFTPLVW